MVLESRRIRRSALAVAVAAVLAFGVSACGGGGGGTRSDPPPAVPGAPDPAPPPSDPPPEPDPDPEPEPEPEPEPDPEPDPDPEPGPTSREPPVNVHLVGTGVDIARAAGFTGSGAVIGVVDSGVEREHPALAGRVLHNEVYVDADGNDLSVDDVLGHGTWVSQVMAGAQFGEWPGGVAPGAGIVSARILSDEATSGLQEAGDAGHAIGSPEFLALMHADLIAHGVRIMNNSWGGPTWEMGGNTALYAGAYEPFVFDNDGLVVFATGNDGLADPGDLARLPSKGGDRAAALERGWLAVAALDSASFAYDGEMKLSEYSNACGVAMRYCLVAPGEVIVTGADDTADAPSYWIVTGTSFAAPQVSGTAALVWEAFPWFDNDLVRQTILGTATDIGDAGVDATFGYGLLDAGRAVAGPGRFDWGDVVADFALPDDQTVYYWDNDIAGSGGLTKRGSGALVLTGENGYLGGTLVEGGVLGMYGSLGSGVQVGAGAGLVGLGGVGGNLHNAGLVGVGGLPSDQQALRVDGDYTQTADAVLAVELGVSLQVAGTATLDGGGLFVAGARPGYTPAGLVNVLSAEGGLDGTFDTFGYDAERIFLEAEIVYGSGSVDLQVETFDALALSALGGFDASTTASAERVEGAFRYLDALLARGDATALPEGFVGAAGAVQQTASMAEAQATLQSLSGEVHAASSALAFETMEAGARALSARLDRLHRDARASGSWSQSLGLHGAQGAGLEFDLDGGLSGHDVRVGESGFAGVAYGQSHGQARDAAGGDSNRGRGSSALAYAGFAGQAWYAQGGAGAGRFDQDVRRTLRLGAALDGVQTRYSGSFASVHGEVGYRLQLGATRLSPFVGAQYAQVHRDGFFEHGGSGFGLRGDAAATSRWQALAGARAARTLQLGGQRIELEAHAQWQQTVSASGDAFRASFTGIDDWRPLATGLDDRGGLFGLRLATALSPRTWLQMDYQQRFGGQSAARMMSASFRYGF
ncbi:S8 family serine peptidase [Luteimonas sp. RD2P54]|uniref:S8 family serine peptidase n=1 Tax=Luteimonas endophytica TaxID=3042023 RepID=A0ABT6JCR4_9GAMM|nr:S8 family serine peptidase [Luteimonas endophytica]MDH5823973.1 S8 family serine peptidase [Luteimonas endophytica]